MPGFFELVDGVGVVEEHIQELLKLEDSRAQRLLRKYREHRQELQDRLSRARPGSFTQQRLRGVLTQVEAGIEAMSASLELGLKELAPQIARGAVEDQLEEIRTFDQEFTGAVTPINISVQQVADDASNFLLNKHEASIDAYGADLVSQLTGQLAQEALAGTSMSEVVQRLGLFFQGEEWKLHRIARTEFHNIYNIAKMMGMQDVQREVLPDLMKTLIHPMDARTGKDSKALARENPIIPINEAFVFEWKGKTRTFMAPPDRPNDRAILVPYRAAWGEP